MKLCDTCTYRNNVEQLKPCIIYRDDCEYYEKERGDMTREEAIDLLDNLIGMIEDNHNSDYDTAFRMAIKALEQEPCGDAISRQALQEWIKDKTFGDIVVASEHNFDCLPPVTPEPKTGYWISHYDEDTKEGWYECDRCHTERAFNTKFCPDCGCRMVESQESEEV